MQSWFKKIVDGDECLEDEEGRGRQSAVDNDELRLVEANLLENLLMS